jgi:uncharacterized membrane protein YphA (DoxX/SURF4 family)
MNLLSKLGSSKAPKAVVLVRLMVGAVFLSEGLQKYLFPAEVGAGRFARIGLPWPEFLGPFVGGFEVVCGALVLLGLFTRLAVIPLLTIMGVALYSTKPANVFRRAEGAGIAAIVSPISVQGLTLWQPETMGCSPYCSERMYCCNRSYYAHYCKKIG